MRYSNIRFVFMSLVLFLGFWYFTTLHERRSHQEQGIDTNLSLEILFERYVLGEAPQLCDSLCQRFYVARFLEKHDPKKALIYYVEAANGGIQNHVEDWYAQAYYLFATIANLHVVTGAYDAAIVWYEKALEAGNQQSLCFLGRVYKEQGNMAKAFALFEQGHVLGHPECTMDLGVLYFNGIYVPQDKARGSALWHEAYAQNSFDADINFNMAVYHFNISKNMDHYKYHLIKAAHKGDVEAQTYLNEPSIRSRNVSHVFVNEAITPEKMFQYRHILAARFFQWFDTEHTWKKVEESPQRVVYAKSGATLFLESKRLHLINQRGVLQEDLRTVIELLYVDLSSDMLEKITFLDAKIFEAKRKKRSFETIIPIDTHTQWRIVYTAEQQQTEFEIMLF